MAKKDSFFTARQLEILRLRKEGLSQTEIARKFGTSRANISATEKTARMNIEKAKNTLSLADMIEAPIWLVLEPNTDLNEAVKEIYHRADSLGIRVSQTFPSLSHAIQESVSDKIKGRMVLKRLEIAITKDGAVIAR
ncbi:MAG: Tfx family DNA-binding protein [Candidatus Hydrothermarchaeaceae archaeon]